MSSSMRVLLHRQRPAVLSLKRVLRSCGSSFTTHSSSKETPVAKKPDRLDFQDLVHQTSARLSSIYGVVHAKDQVDALEQLRQESEKENLWDNPDHAGVVLQQMSVLENRMKHYRDLEASMKSCEELHELSNLEEDEDLVEECYQDIERLAQQVNQLRIETLLSDSNDRLSCFLEIQAGAGGTESCDWVEILLRMYSRWAESRQYKVELVAQYPGEKAGYSSVTLRITGAYAYGWSKTEAGVHRLVRISPFDSQGKRHTSFAQIRIYPIVASSNSGHTSCIEINTKDIRVDTFRSSGAGGQHVNTTNSAIRITHLPSGIVTQSQSGRSQHSNKAEALEMLRSKLLQVEIEKEAQARQKYTEGLGNNEWGSQIRSYILHPYQMVKDHRTQINRNDTAAILDGYLSPFIEAALTRLAEQEGLR